MKKILLFFVVAAIFSSCEKAFMDKSPDDTPENNFRIVWETVDKKYTFFEYKNINWDSIYDVYHPKIRPGMSNTELFDVLSDMLYELKDGHVNLISDFDISRYWLWYLNSPQNFDFTLLERNYLKDDYFITGPLINKSFDSVGYIYYSSFSSTIREKHMDIVLRRFENMKGIIIDIRDNGGGSTLNGDLLAGRFADKKRLVGYEIFKNGPGHNDLTNPFPKYMEPGGNYQFTRPVIVLTNRSSYSASTDFVRQIREFPHVTIMGDTTGGGGGYPFSSELPNGWTYRFSGSISLSPDGFNVENGIPPDIYIEMKEEDMDNGEDTILEAALDKLGK